MINFETQVARLVRLLRSCHENKLWGKVSLQMVNGDIVDAQVVQTLKLEKETAEAVLCVKPVESCESR